MKKLIISLCLGVMMFSLTACGDEPTTVTEKEEKAPEYKQLTDPRGKTLESTATGESIPQLVDTLYETDDVVIADIIPTEMGYAVDPTGETDSSDGLQQAIDDCYTNGGGTVYLPAGNYAISKTISIPPFVTLRGDWQDPDEGTEYGTIISIWMESEDIETAGAFELDGSSGVIGLTIYYPLQSLECIRPYPYTFYVNSLGSNMLQTVKNVTMINSYRGIGSPTEKSHESLQIINVKGTYLKCGFSGSNSADVGTVKNFVVNNKYWKEASADCMNAVLGSAIDDFTSRYTTGLQLADLEWTEFNNIHIDGCAKGVHLVSGTRIEFAGSMYDLNVTNCEQGVVIDGLDTRWGILIAKSYIEGGLVNNTTGAVKLCDVEIEGDVVETKKNTVMIDNETDLSAFAIDYDKSYKKPKENVLVANIPNGLFTDAAPELQEALNTVAKQGGGVVYIPGGTYRFKGRVEVPANVELRGSGSVATRDQRGVGNGTVFLCYYGDDAENGIEDEAFITLAGENAGLNGIRIVYPENSSSTENYNSTYTVRGKAAGVYVVNSMISASAYGIDFRNCDNHYIEGVFTCCYYNAYRLGGTGGTITRCLQNGTVMERTVTTGRVNWIKDTFAELIEPVLREYCDLVIVENAKKQTVYSVFAYGVHSLVHSINSEDTFVCNIGTDNINSVGPQMFVNGGNFTAVNVMRYNGYSYEMEAGNAAFYNRIAINDIGEKSIKKSK